MAAIRTCKQCGQIKDLTEFRPYYGGRKGHYTLCKGCERINNREKYLSRKAVLTENEAEEFDKIHLLWEHQMSLGLRPPVTNGRKSSLGNELDDMLNKYSTMRDKVNYKANQLYDESHADAPAELKNWLTEELDKAPEYYLDEVYEHLVDTYRPMTGIDPETMLPTHDDTHKVLLDRILERFTAYEDNYY